MELEDRNKIEMELEQIIQIESSLINAKYKKIQQDEEAERHKNNLEKGIKNAYWAIARIKRQAILRQKGLKWSPEDDSLCNEESEKEFQRWKNLAPGEKIKEHREEISKLQKNEHEEDWEPMTDIAFDRRMEKEFEKEMEELEKLEEKRRKTHQNRMKVVRETLKNNGW